MPYLIIHVIIKKMDSAGIRKENHQIYYFEYNTIKGE